MNTIKKIFQKLSAPNVKYLPLIEVRVFKDALLHNLRTYQKQYPKLQFAPVLKSNAYGHGLVQVAEILDNEDVAFFMVDSFFEALVLRREGIKSKILVLGYATEHQIYQTVLKNCSFGIISLDTLKKVSQNLKTKKTFHLKIDTGMHRQGILPSEITTAIKLIEGNQNIILEGFCTHFADADNTDKTFTESQIKQWNDVAAVFRKKFGSIKYYHTSNTAGTFYANQIDANVGRLGIGLYGINTSPFSKLNLQPALEMVSIISSIRHIPSGEKVGYGITYESQRPTIVATVPVGYNEGVDRRLSSKGFYKIGNIFCPIAGRVSMNISSIDVTDVPNLQLEDEVVVISSTHTDKNSAENMAKACECLPYEILVRIPQSLRRRIV